MYLNYRQNTNNTKSSNKAGELDLFGYTENDQGKKIANTSIKSYHSEDTKEAQTDIAANILKYLTNHPEASNRQLGEVLKIASSTISGVTSPLWRSKKIYISDVRKCSTTNHQVKFYSIVTDETLHIVTKQLRDETNKQLDKTIKRMVELLDDLDRYEDDKQAA